MLGSADNDLLTQTGASTNGGRLLRQYWLPVMLSSELTGTDCDPQRVRVLGEDLVGFRDSNGSVGILAERCAHRGTSLYFGRNEHCGLRCIYHGWKYDTDGNVLDTPAEPSSSKLTAKVKHTAYPVTETAGLIWIYMGSRSPAPTFPDYMFNHLPVENVAVTKSVLECNWVQGLEGEVDSAHLSFLHREWGPDSTDNRQGLFQADTAPRYEIEETDFGLRLIAIRETDDHHQYVRVTSFVMPVTAWINGLGIKQPHIFVPIDDHRTWRFDMELLDSPVPEGGTPRSREIGEGFYRRRRLDNDYLQDRTEQRESDFTGIKVFINEDAVATESMGHIYDRSQEHLGQSDLGVIALRKYLLKTIRAFADGADPPHQIAKSDMNDMTHIDTLAEVVPAGIHWREHFKHLRLP